MQTLKLSGNMIEISINQQKTVTVEKLSNPWNRAETKVRFIDLYGTIVKSFVCGNSEVECFIDVYAAEYNFNIVD